MENVALTKQEETLILVTDKGALTWIAVDRISAIVPASKREGVAIQNFATQLGSGNGFTQTHVMLETDASSHGTLAVGYIRQTPVWRTTSRISIDDNGALLEAWATVHNDTAEEWIDVKMTLVSGLPQSYVLSVASPRYKSRDRLDSDEAGGLMAQLGANTPDALMYGVQITHPRLYPHAGGGLGGTGWGSGGGGFHSASEVGARGLGGGRGEYASDLLNVGEPAVKAEMAAAVEAEISTYTALRPVSIPSGSSALVPVLQKRLPVRTFTKIDVNGSSQTCMRVRNTSGLVLQSGPTSVFRNGRFAGQFQMNRTEPTAVAIWCYGKDPDVQYAVDKQQTDAIAALEWRFNQLYSHSYRTTTNDYSIENFAGQPRFIAIDMHHMANGKFVTEGNFLSTDRPNRKMLSLTVPPRSRLRQRVEKIEGVRQSVPITSVDVNRLKDSEHISSPQRDILEQALLPLTEQAALHIQVKNIEHQLKTVENAIARKRAYLKDIPAGGEGSSSASGLLDEILKDDKQLQDLLHQKEALSAEAKQRTEAAMEILSRLPSIEDPI